MKSYRNPFRYRTSEQESRQGLQRFLRTFGPGALDLLPEGLWDRLVVIESAPGAGKTSLLRTFTVEALTEIAKNPEDYVDLHARMTGPGVIEGGAVRTLGVRLPLKKGYRSIDDLRLEPAAAVKVFFRYLDAHIVRAVLEALVHSTGERDLTRLAWQPADHGAEALERLGGTGAAELATWSRDAERELLNQLDSVLPPHIEDIHAHHQPYSILALSGAEFTHDGQPLGQRPLLMFDDGQDIGNHQRRALLDVLADRDLDLHRWFAERYQALSAEEIVADGEPNRAYTPIRIEDEARQLGETDRRGGRTRRFEKLLTEISDRRASSALLADLDEGRLLSDFVGADFNTDEARVARATAGLHDTLTAIAEGNTRYDQWIELASGRSGYEGAVACRVTQILIERDKGRKQDTLFAVPLIEAELHERSGSDLREAAALFLRREHGLPFYAGPERLAKLATENIEQHLNIAGQLFEELLAQFTLRRSLGIPAQRQDAILWDTSETFWTDIPKRRAGGHAIQRLLLHIAGLCRRETYRPTAAYAPGVTGTAISMHDRQLLIDPGWRAEHPGAQELFEAMAGAIGHNLLRADLERAVKNDRWMVLSLNRLLCVRFGLPLGYGGFRERPVAELCRWMHDEPDSDSLVEAPLQEQLIP